MRDKIEKLKQIISTNEELLQYSDEIQDNWNLNQINEFIKKILTDFVRYKDLAERPAFYTELQRLPNKYDENNTYKKPTDSNYDTK